MRYQFNGFTLDTDRFELCSHGQPVRSEPQVLELLLLLLENRDRMVSKEEINERIWGGRVVSEAALSSRVKMLRQLLGDTGRAQQVIRTIHKKGLRFVADVVTFEAAPSAAASLDSGLGSLSGAQSLQPAGSSVIADAMGAASPPAREVAPAAGADPARPAIAVLPFDNLSREEGQEYLAEGITADIITHLSKHRWLNVIARNTTFGYKGKAVDVRELGRDLGVDYVIEGSVQRAAGRIRVTARLVDTVHGHQKWAERYDREISDIFSLQDELTETIVARLEPEIGFAERNKVVRVRPANLRAWDCYHLGVYHFYKFTAPDNREAQRLLRQSQELDSLFGEAYAWWAYAVVLGMVYWDTPPSSRVLDEALAACDHALSLDSQNAAFYALRARVLLARREYAAAVTENEIAVSINPTLAAAYCGLGDSLAYEGRYAESIQRFKKAIALSPNDPQLWAFFTYGALALIFSKDYATALQWLDRAASIPNCQYWTTAHKAVALAYLGRREEARTAVDRLYREEPKFSCAFARERLFYLKKQDQIDQYLEGLRMAGVAER